MDSNPLLRKVVGKLKIDQLQNNTTTNNNNNNNNKMRESALVIFSHRIRDGIEKL